MDQVSVTRCDSYDAAAVKQALTAALDAIGGLDWVQKGMKIGIKANLVTALKPDSAAVTHPQVICALTELLKERGAEVVVGDSPGGVYSSAYLSCVYSVTGMKAAEAAGATLNRDFRITDVEYPEGKVLKRFTCTQWLLDVDAIIDVCKLKAHAMMCMSAAVKNLFGAIPGTMKPEYHFRFPNEADFADMLIDLNTYFKPRLSIADAIVGMEGNGPTMGKPRRIGALLASASPFALDRVCAEVIGVTVDDVPTLRAAAKRGLCEDEVEVIGDLDAARVSDFDNMLQLRSLSFQGSGKGLSKIFGRTLERLLMTKPTVKPESCVGCGVCAKTCPAKAIEIHDKLPKIDRSKCIRCFCCQEFCPKGAMVSHRSAVARLLVKE